MANTPNPGAIAAPTRSAPGRFRRIACHIHCPHGSIAGTTATQALITRDAAHPLGELSIPLGPTGLLAIG